MPILLASGSFLTLSRHAGELVHVMGILTNRRPSAFARAVLEARARHLESLLEHFARADIDSAQDFHMLLDIALNTGIRQCEIARTLAMRRSKLSSWSNRISVARAPSERRRIADAIRTLIEEKLTAVKGMIGGDQPTKSKNGLGVPHPDFNP